MKTARNKVLHEVCGKGILSWVLDACREAGIEEQTVIVGAMRDQVIDAFSDDDDITWVVQEPQQGTAHAVMAAEESLSDFEGDLVVIVGDAPLVRSETIRTLLDTHRAEGAAVTLLTAILDDPKWFGRILRDSRGSLQGIIEVKEATPEQLEIREVNPSYYAYHWPALRDVLPRISNDNAKGEYYLTDAVGLLIEAGKTAVAVPAAEPALPDLPAAEPATATTEPVEAVAPPAEVAAPIAEEPAVVEEPVMEAEVPPSEVPVAAPVAEPAETAAPPVEEDVSASTEMRPEAEPSAVTAEDLDEMRAYAKRKRSDHAARLSLARALWHAGEIQESMEHYGRLIKAGARSDEVMVDLEQYVASGPSSASVTRTFGDAHMKNGDLVKALEIYNRAMELL